MMNIKSHKYRRIPINDWSSSYLSILNMEYDRLFDAFRILVRFEGSVVELLYDGDNFYHHRLYNQEITLSQGDTQVIYDHITRGIC